MKHLAGVPIGQDVVLVDLSKIEERLRRRLIALGFYEGCPVAVRRRAIFGGPLTIEQREHRQTIAIRRSDARRIEVFSA
ncbi:FeoA family protein [Exiguobacterium flavidum]|uniref:FeoA family protein n=1 Tax=Exiguobacterium flavidum TaxID=2184695 RepID=UPI000DF81F80|nr:FeoA family protein [Exiguobacterium flavidum]